MDVEDLFAREEAALATHREVAAGGGAELVDPAAVRRLEVTTELGRKERQENATVLVAARVRGLRQLGAPAFAEASEVVLEQNDLVVLAAGRALRAVEVDRARAAHVDRIALGAAANDPVAVTRDERRGETTERARRLELPLGFAHVVDRPEAEVGIVPFGRLAEDEASTVLVLPDDGMAARANVRRGLAGELRGEAADDRPLNGGGGRHGRRFYQKSPVEGRGVTKDEGRRSSAAADASIVAAMKAIVLGTDGRLDLRTVETPEPGPGQARVRVRACGVNRADLLQRRGGYAPPPDAPRDILGLEIAGEVDAIGAGTTDVRVGDRVYGIVSGGAYAEAVVVHARTLAPIPDASGAPLDFVAAAAIPEAFVTAYDAIVLQAGLAAGDTLLIHAIGSGVGTAAAQIARAVGATAIGTARSRSKIERAEALGLTAGIVVEASPDGAPRFADRVRAATAGRGVDVVLELVGGAYVPESLASLADRGRLVLVGLTAGARADVDLGTVLRRRLRIFGTVLRSRPLEEKILAAQVLARSISPLVASGKLVPVVDRTFSLADVEEAHAAMSKNENFGKIVLRIDP